MNNISSVRFKILTQSSCIRVKIHILVWVNKLINIKIDFFFLKKKKLKTKKNKNKLKAGDYKIIKSLFFMFADLKKYLFT